MGDWGIGGVGAGESRRALRLNGLFGGVGSEGTDALKEAWGVGVRFALPSFEVIDEILEIVGGDKATVILIVPAWASRPGWTRLWSAAWSPRRTACLELSVDGRVANSPDAFFLREGGRGFMRPLWAVRLDARPERGGADDGMH